ncbi:hypothetical protein BofuT4_uP021980.1 [Botrytis cinerea T4]|uniref:Uncharacterized protein n=1 Tax=Botryotinia fuckeliana (strain T4) TaxID=999810 RepID=G2YGP6_BOTF4|nr:hypothetical protein BofuT4_uP021980.1 [Botrytis cinerea T4]
MVNAMGEYNLRNLQNRSYLFNYPFKSCTIISIWPVVLSIHLTTTRQEIEK